MIIEVKDLLCTKCGLAYNYIYDATEGKIYYSHPDGIGVVCEDEKKSFLLTPTVIEEQE